MFIFWVKGCDVELLGYFNGVVCVSFFDLCGWMFGLGDYLVIVDVVCVLIIEGIL